MYTLTHIGFSKLVSKSVSLIRSGSGSVLHSMSAIGGTGGPCKKEGPLVRHGSGVSYDSSGVSYDGSTWGGGKEEDEERVSQWGTGIMSALYRKNNMAMQYDDDDGGSDLARMDSMV